MSKWIRKGDRVVVIAGNEKGKVGNVISRKDERVLVQGINIRKRHTKSRAKGMPSQIIEMEKTLHISNVAICSEEGKPVRLKVRHLKNDEKELYYQVGEKQVAYRKVVKHS
jgi:large subunit ribosomal protein L24